MIWNHRAYVGPEEKFYTFGAKMFLTLVEAGLLPEHKVLDVGCGSLRVGRELIPYLDESCYYGIEPNVEQMKAGYTELSEAAMLKLPTFHHSSDFTTREDLANYYNEMWPEVFDWVLAIQVFIHCGPDQLRDFLQKMSGQAKQIFITLKIDEESSQVAHGKPLGERRYNHADFRTTVYSMPHLVQILDDNGWKIHSQPLTGPVQNSFILLPNDPD